MHLACFKLIHVYFSEIVLKKKMKIGIVSKHISGEL